MKKLITVSCFLLMVLSTYAQKETPNSILEKLAIEKNEDKKVDLIISIWETGVDRDPYMLIQTGQALLVQAQKNKDILQEASAYSILGTGYRMSANPIRGLQVQQKGLQLAEKSGDFSILAMVKNQLGHTYRDREEWENAFKLYSGALNDAAKAKNEVVKIWPVMNLGVYYLNVDKLDSSLKYLQRAYKLSIQINKNDLPYILWNLGSVHSKMGNAALAVAYYNMAIQKSNETQKIRPLSFAYIGLAEHFERIKQQDSCIFYLKKALAAVRNTPFFFMSVKPAKMLSEYYEKRNCDSTVKYTGIYKVANDSVFNNKINQQIQVMTFDEELRQKELVTAKMKTDIERKQNLQYALIAMGIVTLIIVFLLLSRSIIVNEKWVSFFGVVGLLVIFEFLNLLLHPFLEKITDHSPVLMLLALVCIAAILVPFHHRIEKWAKERMVEKNKAIRLAAAKKTIATLEGESTNIIL